MTDLELIEAAAKEAGHQTVMCYAACPEDGEPFAYAKLAKRTYFRPFSDDGDAFRLAVKLRIKALYNDRLGSALAWYGGANDFQATVEGGGQDEMGSVRRAIVLAAARLATPAPAQPEGAKLPQAPAGFRERERMRRELWDMEHGAAALVEGAATADEIRRRALEEAAKIADGRVQVSYPGDDWRDGYSEAAREIAGRLRRVAAPTSPTPEAP